MWDKILYILSFFIGCVSGFLLIRFGYLSNFLFSLYIELLGAVLTLFGINALLEKQKQSKKSARKNVVYMDIYLILIDTHLAFRGIYEFIEYFPDETIQKYVKNLENNKDELMKIYNRENDILTEKLKLELISIDGILSWIILKLNTYFSENETKRKKELRNDIINQGILLDKKINEYANTMPIPSKYKLNFEDWFNSNIE